MTAASSFRWLSGERRTRRYALPPPRQYSTDFCADCGGAVPSVLGGQPTVMLPAGSIDSALPELPLFGDFQGSPAVHLYVGSKAPWYTIADGWPQFEELPPPERFTEFFQ
jgi:hypothetical protein